MLVITRRRALMLAGSIVFLVLIVELSRKPEYIYLPADYFINCRPGSCPDPLKWKDLDPNTVTIEQIIDYFNWANRSSCQLIHDFGGRLFRNPTGLDGQKAICLDLAVAPVPGKCLIYSFGINNDFSYDDLMAEYGCEVFAFDPSMSAQNHTRSAKVKFYSLGLGEKDHVNPKGWKINSLDTIYHNLKHDGRIIDQLKMDIEGPEWAILPQILSSGMLAKVRQLAVEVHWDPKEKDFSVFRSYVSVIKSLEDAGMVRFDSKLNPWSVGTVFALNNYTGATCFEIAWYQTLPFG